jgi:hypothetical protein
MYKLDNDDDIVRDKYKAVRIGDILWVLPDKPMRLWSICACCTNKCNHLNTRIAILRCFNSQTHTLSSPSDKFANILEVKKFLWIEGHRSKVLQHGFQGRIMSLSKHYHYMGCYHPKGLDRSSSAYDCVPIHDLLMNRRFEYVTLSMQNLLLRNS